MAHREIQALFVVLSAGGTGAEFVVDELPVYWDGAETRIPYDAGNDTWLDQGTAIGSGPVVDEHVSELARGLSLALQLAASLPVDPEAEARFDARVAKHRAGLKKAPVVKRGAPVKTKLG